MARPRSATGAATFWWWTGVLAFALLPWYLASDLSIVQTLSGVFATPDAAPGWLQASRHGRPWLWSAADRKSVV